MVVLVIVVDDAEQSWYFPHCICKPVRNMILLLWLEIHTHDVMEEVVASLAVSMLLTKTLHDSRTFAKIGQQSRRQTEQLWCR